MYWGYVPQLPGGIQVQPWHGIIPPPEQNHTHCPHCGEAIYHKATPYWSGPAWVVTTNTTIDWGRTNEADSGNTGNLTFSSSEVVK